MKTLDAYSIKMLTHNKKSVSRRKIIQGNGLLNNVINKLPIELHLPGYQYCGPGTKLEKRLVRGDPGINILDKACKEHDIAYSKFTDTTNRHKADKILGEKAWQRVTSKDAKLSERAAALAVTNIMKAKVKLGMGLRIKNKQLRKNINKKRKTSYLTAVKSAKIAINTHKPINLIESAKVALKAAKKAVTGRKECITTPRIIPVPKVGGILPFLVPLFAGLSAVGALSGGAAGIAKAVIEANKAKKELKENKRHNQTMESIAMGKGLYLKPYKNGLGLYLQPQSKN